jgi:hypothetical protein
VQSDNVTEPMAKRAAAAGDACDGRRRPAQPEEVAPARGPAGVALPGRRRDADGRLRPRAARACGARMRDGALADLGSGRTVVSEIKAPNMFAIPV